MLTHRYLCGGQSVTGLALTLLYYLEGLVSPVRLHLTPIR